MGLIVQAPADDPLGGLDGETRHLTPKLGHRLGTLRLRLLAGGLDDALGLLLGVARASDWMRSATCWACVIISWISRRVVASNSSRSRSAWATSACARSAAARLSSIRRRTLVQHPDDRPVQEVREQNDQDNEVDRECQRSLGR